VNSQTSLASLRFVEIYEFAMDTVVRAIPAKMEGVGRGGGMPQSGCVEDNAPASVRSKSGIHLKIGQDKAQAIAVGELARPRT
jgi:hypothetical protein